MGLFDSVYIPCPHCGAPTEVQSKAALYPRCNNYTLDTAPSELVFDIATSGANSCTHCGGRFRLNLTYAYKVQAV